MLSLYFLAYFGNHGSSPPACKYNNLWSTVGKEINLKCLSSGTAVVLVNLNHSFHLNQNYKVNKIMVLRLL